MEWRGSDEVWHQRLGLGGGDECGELHEGVRRKMKKEEGARRCHPVSRIDAGSAFHVGWSSGNKAAETVEVQSATFMKVQRAFFGRNPAVLPGGRKLEKTQHMPSVELARTRRYG